MDDHDPLVERLADLGRQPIDPATSGRHLVAMAAVRPGRGGAWTRLKVAGAFAAGLVLGGTGLASAGVLPAPAQDVAHTTLSKVGVKVPQGTARFNDPAVCGLDPATQQPFRSHGQYVKANKGDPAAAQSRCGKPLKAGTPADPGSPPKPADAPADPADPADPKKPGGENGKGNGNGNGNGGNSGKVKPNKAKDKGSDEAKEPVTPQAPAGPQAPPPTAAATATTVAPTTSTEPTSTTTSTSTTSSTLSR